MNQPELLNSHEPQPPHSAPSAHLSGGTNNPPRPAGRGLGVLLAVLIAAAARPMFASAANAASDPHFEQYSLNANVHSDSTMEVDSDIDYNFQNEESRRNIHIYYCRQEIKSHHDQLHRLRCGDTQH